MNVTDEISKKLAVVNDTIKDHEERMLRAGAAVNTVYGELSWVKHKGRFRIMLGEKPLIEHAIEDRVKGFRNIDQLVARVYARARDLLKDIEEE